MTVEYKDIKTLHEAGQTPQQIADTLNASPLHKRECPITSDGRNNLLHRLTVRYKLMHENPDRTYAGPIIDLEATDPITAGGMSILRHFMAIQGQSAEVNNDVELAFAFNHVVNECATLAVNRTVGGNPAPTANSAQEVIDDIYALTGGLKYQGITAEHVQDAINNNQAESDRSQLQDDYSVMGEIDIKRELLAGNRTGMIAALRSTADNLEGV